MNPLTNLPSTTADAVLAEAASGPVDALDALLRQIVARLLRPHGRAGVGLQVVTSPPSCCSTSPPTRSRARASSRRWSAVRCRPPARRGVGSSTWASRRASRAPSRSTGRRSDGADFPMETVFVPVKLDEGFDFSLFLEDLVLRAAHRT